MDREATEEWLRELFAEGSADRGRFSVSVAEYGRCVRNELAVCSSFKLRHEWRATRAISGHSFRIAVERRVRMEPK